MGRLIEGLWDCNYCGTKGNRGSIRECPNCGRPRDEKTKFYMPKEKTYVSDAKARTINRNPDWICIYCNSLNSDSYNTCRSCGSQRNSENLDYFSNQKLKHTNHSVTIKQKREKEKSNSTIYGNNTSKDNFKKKNKQFPNFIKNNWKPLIIIPLILGIIIGIICLFIPRNEEITIKELGWERSIEIERYQTVEESGWSLPSNVRLKYTRTEFSHYQSVLDHYETKTRQVAKQRISGYESYVSGYRDLGNGYFEEIISERPIYETYYETETYQEPVYREEPVYLTKYYYEIDKWLYERAVSTGGLNTNPYWGKVELKENERIANKFQKYYINGINSNNDEKTIPLDYDVWNKLSINQTVKFKVSILGHVELIE